MNKTLKTLLTVTASLSVLNAAPTWAAVNEHRPVCSPDGSQMIYMLKSELTKDDWELYLLDFDSQVRTRLTNHPGWDGYAVWSPDGSKIIFDRQNDGGEDKNPWIMDVESQRIKPFGHHDGWVSISDWSEDNRLLGFQELEDRRDLVILNKDGEIVEQLTSTATHNEHDAHFSPDAKMIAYANGAIDGNETTLELINLEEGSSTVLHRSIGRIYGISWTPDGSKIAFVDAPGGEDDDADIFVYSLEDESISQKTDDPSWDHMPEFCNSAEIMYFTSYRSGEERIYQINPDPTPVFKIERDRSK